MQQGDVATIEQLGRYASLGGFIGMVLVGQLLWFDVSSIGSMLKASDNALLVNLFLGGAMLKGALLGAALGATRLRSGRELSVKRSPEPASMVAALAEAR